MSRIAVTKFKSKPNVVKMHQFFRTLPDDGRRDLIIANLQGFQ